MGYILPITQFEYIQYANRTVSADKLPQKVVEGVNPIMPITFMEELDRQTSALEKNEPLPAKRETKSLPAVFMNHPIKNRIPEHLISKTQSELTGKGAYINQTI
ncbi:hypothetical protein [Bacillus sp. V5-8f]|uniref:hypothetical protein n=1 Tax=Bacillus sp. V5-8f TaxID=2053044 RepID=UPI000C7899A0|nr:hypothetical protein [Bacillus sp. V5-8f]PLT33903.1 hypothetical protein CUU64_12395 [Bacillus sp. V5-8f]